MRLFRPNSRETSHNEVAPTQPTGEAAIAHRNPPWLARAMAGDEEAMHQLVLHVMPRVRNGVRYLVRGEHIDDLVQDVLVTVLHRLESYRGSGRFEAWVDGVTLRVVLGRTRKLRQDERRLTPVDNEEVFLLHHNEHYATSRQLVRALDQLPNRQREALVLHHVFGLTAPEIASKLELPRETVRSRIKVGMGQLRALLRVPTHQPAEANRDD